MKVRVPASCANLGPGFDTLALAVNLYMEIEAIPDRTFQVISNGREISSELEKNHVINQILKDFYPSKNLKISIESNIPVARGLGSSGALIVGTLGALGVKDILKKALSYEGHWENIAASFSGGLVAIFEDESFFDIRSFKLDENLAIICVIPEVLIKTEQARKVLPRNYPRDNVIFNLKALARLIRGLEDLDKLDQKALEDKIHQPYREKLFPQSKDIIQILLASGCLGACWSGSGSSMIGFCDKKEAETISEKVKTRLKRQHLAPEIKVLRPDHSGLTFLQ